MIDGTEMCTGPVLSDCSKGKSKSSSFPKVSKTYRFLTILTAQKYELCNYASDRQMECTEMISAMTNCSMWFGTGSELSIENYRWK